MTQIQKILRHLQVKGSISNVEAQNLYKCRALPRRISDLQEKGHTITRQWRQDLTGQRYTRYFLEGASA